MTRVRLKELAAVLTALAMLLGALGSLWKRSEAQAADTRVTWDNFGEYTVPEIEKLKDRVEALEKSCKVEDR